MKALAFFSAAVLALTVSVNAFAAGDEGDSNPEAFQIVTLKGVILQNPGACADSDFQIRVSAGDYQCLMFNPENTALADNLAVLAKKKKPVTLKAEKSADGLYIISFN